MPLRNHTAPTVARALMLNVFSRFGNPLQLLSDRGPEFESDLFRELCKWMEIDKIRTTAYRPSVDQRDGGTLPQVLEIHRRENRERRVHICMRTSPSLCIGRKRQHTCE